MKSRLAIHTAAALTLMLAILPGRIHADPVSPPNILIVLADDCTFRDLPVYGGENAKTPNIDRLATQGLTFNRAYLAEAMCTPCRSALYTGRFPMHNGAAYNHANCREGTISLPQYLSPLGYRVGIAGKTDVRPEEVFPFEMVPGFDRNCVRNPTLPYHLTGIREFMSRDSSPFCLVVALTEPHVPWVMGDPSKYPPEQLVLPPYLADTLSTREAYSTYLAEITYMDSEIGDILKTLEETGKAGNTLVVFSSEQGAQFPGAKWTNWDIGLHTGLIARWPDHIAAGKRTDAIVQYVDIVPTLIDLAGGSTSGKSLDGSSFAAVLHGETQTHRTYAYGIQNNIPAGPPYPIRSITDGTFRYIRNLTPDSVYIAKNMMGSAGSKDTHRYWYNWVYQAADNPEILRLINRFMIRPAEQLYHTSSDPYEMTNLADNPEHETIKATLAKKLDEWMKDQNDPGAPVDTPEAFKAAEHGQPIYGKGL